MNIYIYIHMLHKYFSCGIKKIVNPVIINEPVINEPIDINSLEYSIDVLNKIKDKDTKDIQYFSFNKKIFYGLPCNIYDGDTFSIIFQYKDEFIKYRCRTLGYDSPEMKPSLHNVNRLREKELAIQAKERFTELLSKHPSTLVKIECFEFEKYGRILVKVWNMVDEKSINDIMVEEGHGKIYDGGTKEKNWI